MRRESYRGVALPKYADREISPTDEATIVLGLGFGDECKGMAVAHETGRAVAQGLDALNVRFNGGAQAAHNVSVRKTDGTIIHHTHSQFGSGTLLGASTLLTRGMLVSPIAMKAEAERLADVLEDDALPGRLMVDARAPVILPFHGKVNRLLEERRGASRHGSTGLGIGVARTCEAATQTGEADEDKLLTVQDLVTNEGALRKLRYWVPWVERRFGVELPMSRHEMEMDIEWAADSLRTLVGCGARILFGGETDDLLRERLDDSWTSVIFEGSQGVLLDERYGWFPHVTYGDMTAKNACDLIGDRKRHLLGITRCYQTRHGAGPMPTEGTYETEEHFNGDGRWTGAFRTGLLDIPTLGRVAGVIRPDAVVVSNLDRNPNRYVSAWEGEATFGECSRPVPSGAIVTECDEDGMLDAIGLACGGAPVEVVGRGEVTMDWEDLQD